MNYTLRVSVLELCQLQCRYCLPERLNALAKKNWLTLRHYEQLALVLKAFPIKKIRFTGGEPLARKELCDIIAVFHRQLPTVELALTTNGLLYRASSGKLKDAGLSSITFHLDTLREERYQRLMGKGQVATVIDNIFLAKSLGAEVKLNVVVQKGSNDDEIGDFLWWSKDSGIAVRFIELMNTGSAKEYVKQAFMSGAEILSAAARHTAIVSHKRSDPHAPAEQFYATDLGLSFGLIASDTRPFCQNCNRVRLSADGTLRGCLYEPKGHDIGLKRDPAPDNAALTQRITQVLGLKASFHPALSKKRQDFSMSAIGG